MDPDPQQDHVDWLRETSPAGVQVYELSCAICDAREAGVTRRDEDPPDRIHYCDRCCEWA
jgi:hypothetical protein